MTKKAQDKKPKDQTKAAEGGGGGGGQKPIGERLHEDSTRRTLETETNGELTDRSYEG